MFEEVPRDRRRLAGWPARRIILGPFVIGSGFLLAAVGGSVAVAATVITASTIRAEQPPRHVVGALATSRPAASGAHPGPAASRSGALPPTGSRSAGVLPATTPEPTRAGSPPDGQTPGAPMLTISPSSPHAGPTTSADPLGNALIYVSGYDSIARRVLFQYATAQRQPDGSEIYSISSANQFSAAIATGIAITSAGTICQPVGGSCTVDQLVSAAGSGFFAEAAIDPSARLQAVIELGKGAARQLAPAGSLTAPSPTPTATSTGPTAKTVPTSPALTSPAETSPAETATARPSSAATA